MKIDEVPQDDANLFEGKTHDVSYALDENGKYTTVKSVGWDPKNTAMLQAWDYEKAKIDKAREEVKQGKKSPLYYHMRKNLMDLKILSLYSGFSKFRIKRHFKPAVFKKLSEKKIARYLEAFGCKLKSDLFNIDQE
jgi:hypothetical protein